MLHNIFNFHFCLRGHSSDVSDCCNNGARLGSVDRNLHIRGCQTEARVHSQQLRIERGGPGGHRPLPEARGPVSSANNH